MLDYTRLRPPKAVSTSHKSETNAPSRMLIKMMVGGCDVNTRGRPSGRVGDLQSRCGWLESTAPEELGEDAAAGFLGVAWAALRLRDAGHDLVDVLAAAGPGGLATFSAGDLSAHDNSPFL